MTPSELRDRTRVFAVAVCRYMRSSPATPDHARSQVVRSACSVAANYRAACLARSRKEFIARMGVVLEEADEAVFWLQILDDVAGPTTDRTLLLEEARALTRIFGAACRTLRHPR